MDTATLQYDSDRSCAPMTNIVDAANLSSSLTYDGTKD